MGGAVLTGVVERIGRATRVGLAVALVGSAAIVPGEGAVEVVSFTVPAASPDVSPARCQIQFVSWPHPSESVPGAIKVNAKSQCDRPVQELDLSVTLLGDNMKTLKETVTKETGKAYIMNQSTYIMCKNADPHTFQGAAMGTSWEDGKPYVQFKFSAKKQWPCGY